VFGLPQAERYLKPEWTMPRLEGVANAISDNEAMRMMSTALRQLYLNIHELNRRCA